MLDFVRINKLSELSGYTVKAIEKKIERGDWVEGIQYLRAPDGSIHISLKAYEAWLKGNSPASKSTGRASASASSTRESDAVSRSA